MFTNASLMISIVVMRTTVTIDDTLLENAANVAGEKNASALITKALEALVAAESKKRILTLSGKVPAFHIPNRTSRTKPH